ncbi:glycosyltransferase [Pedobacter sp. L105]|uniref:glycosyltransferase family 2 protein n=1 Tax=Pedobacter sp. L105 TaxID=1641871 RepID=UPI00131B28F0|nr:glycosyltransferase [Pedobacter sp. L105]
MPKVSVILPNYNHAVYLTQRIDSILSQSYQDFELIILDDNSKDDSTKVIDTYRGHPKITHIIYNDENSGSTFKQWEKGIEVANGEFIWIAESDDWSEKNLLEELVTGIEKDQNCVISYCQSYCVYETNVISWVSQHPYLSELMEGSAFIKQYMLMNNTIFNASMVLWKRDLFPKITKEFKNYKLSGDWIFWIELANLGKVHISGRVLNYFRKHDKDISGKAFKSGLNFLEALKIINSLYERNLVSKKDYHAAFKMQFRNYYPIKNSLPPEFKKEIDLLFKHPLTAKSLYYKILLSAVWRNIK